MNDLRLALVALLVVGVVGCGPGPVSDEATVTLEGEVLQTDGGVAAGEEVKLWKSDLGGLQSDIVADWLVSSTLQPFRVLSTDSEGRFDLSMPGADANEGGQRWAAQFAVTIQLEPTTTAAAVASEAFRFSNTELNYDVGTLRFWDLESLPSVGTTEVTLTLPRAADTDAATKHHLAVTDGSWLAETALSASIPLSALEPCQERAVNDTDVCTPKTSHELFAFATGGPKRYRTRQVSFTATNPKGAGLSLRQANNQSGTTCASSKNIFDLNDHKFSGTQAVADLTDTNYDGERGCFTVVLKQGASAVTEVYVHQAVLSGGDSARIEVSTTTDDPAGAPTWVALTSSQCTQSGWGGTRQVRCAGAFTGTRGLKFEVVGAPGAGFQRVGEVVVYDQ